MRWWIYKKGIGYKCSPNQFSSCNHITLEWDGAFGRHMGSPAVVLELC
jgi:hypothetical protein